MAVDQETIRRMLESGAKAPSGDNLQPWRVVVDEETIHLSVDRSRDRSLYNFEGRASLIALGAMIENLTLAGREYGVDVDTTLSAPENNADNAPTLVSARLVVRPAEPRPEPLFSAVARRCTNRKPYGTAPIEAAVAQKLRASVAEDSAADLRLIEDRNEMRFVARAASLNDRLLFEIRPLHDRFFESVRWTLAEAEATRDGLYVKTLELGAMAGPFKASRSWGTVRLTNLLGGSRLAPRHSFQTFMRSAAFAFLQVSGVSGVSGEVWVRGGRLMQRLWLTAVSLGLSVQPMAGMLCLLPYLRTDGGSVPAASREVIAQADTLFRKVLPLSAGQAPVMLFRVGYGAAPTTTALRRVIDAGTEPANK
jgi:nitroreductase